MPVHQISSRARLGRKAHERQSLRACWDVDMVGIRLKESLRSKLASLWVGQRYSGHV